MKKIPERTKRLLDVFSGESYSSDGRLILDLGISEDDTSTVLPVIRRYAAFLNGYLDTTDMNHIVIGNGLSDYLKADIGDTIVLMGQGYHGTTAAGKFTVIGIVKLPTPDIDNIVTYIPVESARELYAAPGMATSAVIRLKNNSDEAIMQTAERLNKIVPEPMAIKTWQEMNAPSR